MGADVASRIAVVNVRMMADSKLADCAMPHVCSFIVHILGTVVSLPVLLHHHYTKSETRCGNPHWFSFLRLIYHSHAHSQFVCLFVKSACTLPLILHMQNFPHLHLVVAAPIIFSTINNILVSVFMLVSCCSVDTWEGVGLDSGLRYRTVTVEALASTVSPLGQAFLDGQDPP